LRHVRRVVQDDDHLPPVEQAAIQGRALVDLGRQVLAGHAERTEDGGQRVAGLGRRLARR